MAKPSMSFIYVAIVARGEYDEGAAVLKGLSKFDAAFSVAKVDIKQRKIERPDVDHILCRLQVVSLCHDQSILPQAVRHIKRNDDLVFDIKDIKSRRHRRLFHSVPLLVRSQAQP